LPFAISSHSHVGTGRATLRRASHATRGGPEKPDAMRLSAAGRAAGNKSPTGARTRGGVRGWFGQAGIPAARARRAAPAREGAAGVDSAVFASSQPKTVCYTFLVSVADGSLVSPCDTLQTMG